MLGKLTIFGIGIPITVPDKPKKKRRKGSKALSAPRKDKMVRAAPARKSSSDGEERKTFPILGK